MNSSNKRVLVAFAPLAERPDAVRQVARWWCDEWGLPQRHESFDAYVGELANLTPENLPFHLLAIGEDRILGVATLKDKSNLQQMFSDFHYWLSGVFVPPAVRGRGIATALCLKMVEFAGRRGVKRLHLTTEALDGGLYARIGWKPIVQIHEDVELLVMGRDVP